MRTRSSAKLVAASLPLLLLGCDFPSGGTDDVESIPARVAIVMDGTASFASHIPAAQEVVRRFIAKNAIEGSAEVLVYRLDRDPRLVGKLAAYSFLNKRTSSLLEDLKSVAPTTGTDFTGAIDLAAAKLRAPSETRAERLFLLVFSDGHCDPSIDGGRMRAFTQISEYDWSRLKGITTRIYFMAPGPYKELIQHTSNAGVDLIGYEAPEGADPKALQQMVEGF